MSDEQATILTGLLTEIRDELRLVRSAVIPSNNPADLSDRLIKATSSFERALWYTRISALPMEEFDAALKAGYQLS
jgi:hypothetical protein